MANKYDASSIDVIETQIEIVQKKPQLYIPDKRMGGALHIIREIVDNAQDEVMNAGGNVEVFYDEVSREVKVTDTGRGMPLEKLAELCEKLHSSGKFNNSETSAYTSSGGLNGVGLKLANFLSDYFRVTSMRDGKSVTRYYESGFFKKEKKEKSDEHGTIVVFKLSDKHLSELDKIKCKHIQNIIEEKTDCCEGLVTKFKGITKDGKTIKEKYVGAGIDELMKKYMKPTSKIWEFEFGDKKTSYKMAFGYDSKATEGSDLMGWTNFIYNKDGGVHVDAIVDTLYDFFKKYMDKHFFSEKEKKNLQFRKEDIKLGLCGVIVIKTSKDPLYYGQFKQKVTAEWITDEISSEFGKRINKLPDSDLQTISKIIRENIKARMSSVNARKQVKKVGNGLSKDRIEKLIPVRMGCTTDYNELYIVEGLSAGTQAEQGRLDYQMIYMLRGKIDNIYDMSISELSKVPIIEDLSRILGIQPGKRGNILVDRVLCLSDADPDGLSIRAGVVVAIACAFPQVIEEGRLYMVEPPLFAFTDNSKRRFVSTNRDYLTYLQKKFAKENELYRNGKKLSQDQIADFLIRNERYSEFLKNVADANICSEKFTELIISNLHNIGIDKKSIPEWNKLISKNFTKQIKAVWEEGRIVISGIKDGRYEMIELDEDLLKSKKTHKLVDNMNANLNIIYGYGVNDSKGNLSISDVLEQFYKYKGKDLKRFKGLGEMQAKDLGDTCMDPENQKSVKITTKDIDKAVRELSFWHSKKQASRDARRDFMMKYIPDLQEIST